MFIFKIILLFLGVFFLLALVTYLIKPVLFRIYLKNIAEIEIKEHSGDKVHTYPLT